MSFALPPNADTHLPGATGRSPARTGWMNSCRDIVGADHNYTIWLFNQGEKRFYSWGVATLVLSLFACSE